MTGTSDWACATSGRTAAPPSSVMNARRFTRSPRRRGEDRSGNFEAERFGSLKIDDELVLGRRLHGKIGGRLALENTVDVAGCAPELIGEIGPIGDQAAGDNEVACVVDRGHPTAGCQLDD